MEFVEFSLDKINSLHPIPLSDHRSLMVYVIHSSKLRCRKSLKNVLPGEYARVGHSQRKLTLVEVDIVLEEQGRIIYN